MIKVKEINQDNVFDVCELTSNKDGIGTLFEEFICCNAYSIAEAKYFSNMHPKALYKNDLLIGFFMYKHEKGSTEVELCRYMLDYKYIGKGLGKESFKGIIDYFKNQEEINTIILMIDKENTVAENLYNSFGFTFTGKIYKEEYYYSLSL